MQGNSRRIGPEVQDALSAQQQAQQAQELTPLQEQLDGFRDALEQQKAAAQKLEQVTHASCCCCQSPNLPKSCAIVGLEPKCIMRINNIDVKQSGLMAFGMPLNTRMLLHRS